MLEMAYSKYKKQRILQLIRFLPISRIMKEKNMPTTAHGIWKFLMSYLHTDNSEMAWQRKTIGSDASLYRDNRGENEA